MENRLRIVCDDKIPFLEGVFDKWADVIFLPGAKISRADLEHADALVVRTRTLCNASLLQGTPVKAVATATIGMDHIDGDWCEQNGIKVFNAAGCNAGGVMQYVFACLAALSLAKGKSLQDKTLGIVGVGNVGKRVEALGRAMGFRLLLCDPPRAAREGGNAFVSLDRLLSEADIVTMHVPLDSTTRGMCNARFFQSMREDAIFINAARGEIVDNAALKAARGRLAAIVVDTWNGEPAHLDMELLEMTDIATPHIAGYSYQGKQNGTAMAVRQLSSFFGIDALKDFYPATEGDKALKMLDFENLSQNQCMNAIFSTYNPYIDDRLFRANPDLFEKLRGDYDLRAEFTF